MTNVAKQEPLALIPAFTAVAPAIAWVASLFHVVIPERAVVSFMVMFAFGGLGLARRRTVAIHPSTGRTVGSATAIGGVYVTQPKGQP